MRLKPLENGFQVDAADLAPFFGLNPEDVPRLMREGRITSLSEEGRDEDEGRFRVTFRFGSTRVRFVVDARGEVLLRTRTTVAPRPDAPPGLEF